MTNSDTIALVTGANKGIGRETVRRLAEQGWTVWLGSRDPDRGQQAAAELQAAGDVRPVELDVTDDESVSSAAKTIETSGGRLDVLVNNAGIGGPWIGAEETEPHHFLPVFGVNLLGPVRTTAAFLPLLRRSAQPRVVMVSSGMGSFGITTDPTRLEFGLGGLIYPASKAALNMVTSQYAKALSGFQVNAVDPGYTATDLDGHRGYQTVQQGAEAIVRAASLAADGPTGTFFDRQGPVPW
jgi:NAD(P)-dependent dehydrogenase (short-subunit alcohol dehydrogenase family)